MRTSFNSSSLFRGAPITFVKCYHKEETNAPNCMQGMNYAATNWTSTTDFISSSLFIWGSNHTNKELPQRGRNCPKICVIESIVPPQIKNLFEIKKSVITKMWTNEFCIVLQRIWVQSQIFITNEQMWNLLTQSPSWGVDFRFEGLIFRPDGTIFSACSLAVDLQK